MLSHQKIYSESHLHKHFHVYILGDIETKFVLTSCYILYILNPFSLLFWPHFLWTLDRDSAQWDNIYAYNSIHPIVSVSTLTSKLKFIRIHDPLKIFHQHLFSCLTANIGRHYFNVKKYFFLLRWLFLPLSWKPASIFMDQTIFL